MKINKFIVLGVFALALTASFTVNADNTSQINSGKLTSEYVEQVGADAYFWAWPMINIANRLEKFKPLPHPVLMNGVAPVGPTNHLSMLTNYIKPQERDVACPNQDVVYGSAILDLSKEPVVIQVPDFKNRFWVYQIVNQRTDSFAKLGAMYTSKPGLYLLAGPGWKGKIPAGIKKVFKSDTNTGFVIPRVFMKDTEADRQEIVKIVNQVNLYPLSEYTGKMKTTDWTKTPSYDSGEKKSANAGETKWVVPEMALEEIDAVLTKVPQLKGEESLYANYKNVIRAAKEDPKLKEAFIKGAKRADTEIIDPLLQFGSYGIKVKDYWGTINNGAEFGLDYFTRTAAGRSNIFVNTNTEAKYFYQDVDKDGNRLNGKKDYEMTFAKGQLPPVKGFWSLTMYDKVHFFVENDINRYSLGTKNEDLVYNQDGSLTIYIQASEPSADKKTNWLPAPKDDFSLYIRGYWPKPEMLNGTWTPPAVVKK